MNKFYGTGIALVTPFKTDGSVDHSGLKNIIDYVISGGVDYLVSLGTTGEAATLDAAEKKAVWKTTVEHTAGRVPLIAGIGGNNTSAILNELKEFDIDGFDAILSVSPYYSKPSQEGIYQHYKAIAETSPLPVLLYNVPGRTSMNMSAATIIRLAHDLDNIIGVKDACGNFDQFSQILRDKPDDFLLISGDDGVALPLVSMGAAGVISVIGNAVPDAFSTLIRMALSGKFEEARPLHLNLIEFTNLAFIEGNPAGVKSALKLLGKCEDILRLPLVRVSEETRTRIEKELRKIGLLS
jgi:4-hydroxy-tetrahydrodipicolinate synthase